MNSHSPTNQPPSPVRGRPFLLWLGLAAAVILGYVLLRPARSNGNATAYYEVKRGDFTVSIVEGGTLAAVKEVSIRSEVEGTARIISIVPEGSYVKKGDLLIELDSSQAQDQVNQQQINFEKATFAVEQAKAQLEIQKSTTNSEWLAAKLKVQFAKNDRDKYLEGQQWVDMVEASNKLVQAQALLALNLDTFRYSTNLAEKGYETKQKVESDRLTVLGNSNSLVSASSNILMLRKFDIPKFTDKYNSELEQAEQELARVISQNRRRMLQYEADLLSQSNTLVLNEQKLKRDRKNLESTKINAPQDGLVVYQVSENRFSSESLIEGGAVVRNRQELIKLPDLSRMKVTVKIHESHINMLRPGLPAFVTLDSAPEIRYAGVVERVAPLPDTQARWGNPNLKVYNTDIYITDTLPNVKPGVSAKAEIVITNIANTLSVPIQAVTTFRGKQVAYVLKGSTSEPHPIEAGLFNTKFIEITAGLKEGDRVLLSPPFDSQEKDLEGSILTAEEKAKVAATNRARANPATTPRAPAETPALGAAPGGVPDPGAAAANPEAGAGARRTAMNPEEMMKQFDKDGDGQLDETERAAMRAAMGNRGGSRAGGGPRMNREEMLKRFDKNGDGELDEEERNAMRAAMGGGGRPNRGERGQDGGGEQPQRPEGGAAPGPRDNGAPTPNGDRAPEPKAP